MRTLSALHPAYNPVDYQVGSVWPHDNAIIVAGMQRYGFDEEANQVFTAVMLAASKFEHFRLPEVFAGYDRGVASKPVKYPVACNPQALAAGSIPHMLASTLGLQPDAFNRTLRIRHPHLAGLVTVGQVMPSASGGRRGGPQVRAVRPGDFRGGNSEAWRSHGEH